MFKLLGALLACYVGLCIVRGRVFAKRGAWGGSIERDAEPERFWPTIIVYVALAAALMFVF
jgi:hypothetical protein